MMLMSQLSNKKELEKSIDQRSLKNSTKKQNVEFSNRPNKKLPTIEKPHFRSSRADSRKRASKTGNTSVFNTKIFTRPLTRKTFDVRNLEGNHETSQDKKSKFILKNKKAISTDKLGNINFNENAKLVFLEKKSENFPEMNTKKSHGGEKKKDGKLNLKFHFKSLTRHTTPGKVDGYSKTNQDCSIILKLKYNQLMKSYFTSDLITLIGVFDGHGNNGHHVSGFLVKNLRSKKKFIFFLKKNFFTKNF